MIGIILVDFPKVDKNLSQGWDGFLSTFGPGRSHVKVLKDSHESHRSRSVPTRD